MCRQSVAVGSLREMQPVLKGGLQSMPEKISLDDSSYESIYENALSKMQKAAPWWTHREVSDPGITLLEMWSILVDMQSFYLDQVQESHYRKYLKLLGIPLQEGSCSWVWVFFENVKEDFCIPRGAKLLADKMVFETKEEVQLTSNSLCGFYREKRENKMEAMSQQRKSGFFLNDGEILFSFSLKKEIGAGERLTLFVLVDEKNPRNPLDESSAEQDFFLVQLAWEYWTETGWREAKVVRDDTRSLFFSGCICLQTKARAALHEDRGYEIRCRIKKGSYDVRPVIYKISLNAVRVFQRDTLCCCETAEFSGETDRIRLKSYLALTGDIRVMLRQDENFWRDITAECRIDPPVKRIGQDRYLYFPGEGEVKIICTVPGAVQECGPLPVSGVASQQFALPWDNVLRQSVELMLGREGIYRTYPGPQEPEEECSGYAWHWQEEKNVITLGDGRHGEIPPPAREGLLVVSLALCEGKAGNISIGRIKRWDRPELFPESVFTNLLVGRGGEDRLSPREQFEGLRDLCARENRMVTEEDIKALAKGTPGLKIKEAEAEWRDGETVVTVTPIEPFADQKCAEKYRECVQRHLEKYRLVGSRFRIVVKGEN